MSPITVIVPLYNKASTIVRALKSVVDQTFQDFELIVVDDGSTDGGAELVDRHLADSRLRLLRQENAGPGAARNRGVRESTSHYIAFLDADDELLPDFLQQSVANLEGHQQCALSTCASIRGIEQEMWCPPADIALASGVWSCPPDAPPRLLRWASFAIHISAVVRREAFLEFGGFYENKCTFGEDTYLWLQILLRHPIYREPTPLMWYHTEEAGLNVHYPSSLASPRGSSYTARPLLPLLTDPSRVRQNSPGEKRDLLERYLAFEALSEALARTSHGDVSTALKLMQDYPRMASFTFDYAKLRTKIAFPPAARLVSALKGRRGT